MARKSKPDAEGKKDDPFGDKAFVAGKRAKPATAAERAKEVPHSERIDGPRRPPRDGEGRPSKYDPAYAEQAEVLCKLGATDEEIADFFKVDVRTIHRWKHEFPEFCHSLKIGKDAADARVERSLYHRAIGYKHDAVKIFMPAGKDDPVYAPYVEHVQPDTTAAIFWLKNRKSKEWRDKQEVEVTGDFAGLLAKRRKRDA